MIKIVINPVTGGLEKVELVTSDKNRESHTFAVYHALRGEIRNFAKATSKAVRLKRAVGVLI